jgi:hypothetical protein
VFFAVLLPGQAREAVSQVFGVERRGQAVLDYLEQER